MMRQSTRNRSCLLRDCSRVTGQIFVAAIPAIFRATHVDPVTMLRTVREVSKEGLSRHDKTAPTSGSYSYISRALERVERVRGFIW
jgi:hypothetical protein